MAFLELVKGALPGTRFELDGERAVIGRSAECEVPLDVPAVSRRHAAILRERGRFFVEDLQSRNGTFLNDSKRRRSHAAARRRPAGDLRPGVSLLHAATPRRCRRRDAISGSNRASPSWSTTPPTVQPRQRDGHVRRQRRLGQLAAVGQARSEAGRPDRNLQQPRRRRSRSKRFCRSCSTACSRSSCRPIAGSS